MRISDGSEKDSCRTLHGNIRGESERHSTSRSGAVGIETSMFALSQKLLQ
jgi:hypothetical protein